MNIVISHVSENLRQFLADIKSYITILYLIEKEAFAEILYILENIFMLRLKTDQHQKIACINIRE
jgi:hypothetical protein